MYFRTNKWDGRNLAVIKVTKEREKTPNNDLITHEITKTSQQVINFPNIVLKWDNIIKAPYIDK